MRHPPMWSSITNVLRRFCKFSVSVETISEIRRSADANIYGSYLQRQFIRPLSMSEASVTPQDTKSDVPSGFTEITEGRARILFPSSNEVFYNPVQEFNRDLSTLVLNHFTKKVWEPNRKKRKKKEVCNVAVSVDKSAEQRGEGEMAEKGEGGETDEEQDLESGIEAREETDGVKTESSSDATREETSLTEGVKVLEALAASGLRSIRYALEVPAVTHVVANDYSSEAYSNMCRNISHNSVEGKVVLSCKEASMLMYEHKDPLKQFAVIDLDPYGSPSVFLDSAVQAVSDGGMLCITCTDASVLCGNNPETCYSKYGSVSLKLKCCHEMGLRIILSSLESHANRYKRYIVPLISCSVDFYMRVFVQVFTSPAQVKRSLSKRSMVYACSGCESYYLQPLGKRLEEGTSKKYPAANGPPVDRRCEQCGWTFKLGGPIWSAPMHDTEFVHGLLEEIEAQKTDYYTAARIKGLLTVVSEELHDVPLHYVLDQICNTLHCNMPNMLALRSAIMEQGYRVSISHTSSNAIKTDAPNTVLWDIMRCWVKQRPVKLRPKTPGAAILSTDPQIDACFSIRKGSNPQSRQQKLSRFPENPEANWGPKTRAKRKAVVEKENESKRVKVQDEHSE